MNSTKYHINAAGDVKPCKATKRACRYGGEQYHYSTLEAAQKAYEDAQQGSFGMTATSNAYDAVSAAQIQRKVTALIKSFFNDEGKFVYPLVNHSWSADEGANADYEIKIKTPEGFTFLDGGVDTAVFVDEDGQNVYKIPNESVTSFYSRYPNIESFEKHSHYKITSRSEDNTITLGAELVDHDATLQKAKLLQNSYVSVDEDRLKEKYDCRLARTSFYHEKDATGTEIPVIVQEYLSDAEGWEHYEIPLNKQVEIRQDFPLINDTHLKNVRRNRHTGEVVFIDWYNAYQLFLPN